MKKFNAAIVGAAFGILLGSCGGGVGESGSSLETLASLGPAPTAVTYSLERVASDAAVSRIEPRLLRTKGMVNVWVQLDQNSVAEERAAIASSEGLESSMRITSKASLSRIQQASVAQRAKIRDLQNTISSSALALGGRELARVQVAHNAIALRVDSSQLAQLASVSGVKSIRAVKDYQLDLSETVPYVGAAAVQAGGIDGKGVTVAVLDTGVDYTHRNLGGPGTVAAYEAAYGLDSTDPKNTTTDGLFPTDKVVGGYDFVGESWPDGELAKDPDPIDFNGHGTHVADIIAGKSTDGTHVGVAPGAHVLAIRVCSAVSTACSGIALLEAMDFALDPNGDGDMSDAADVINLSLGADYGQVEDDLTQATVNAVSAGVVVVAAAGNAADKPYIVSQPSIGRGVISVAQTQVPSAKAYPLVINAPTSIAGAYSNTATMAFAPINFAVTGDVVYVGRGCPADSIGPGSAADPYSADPVGKIALISRGACAVSLKIDRAAKSGAIGVLLGLVAPGDAVSFSYGGGAMFVPTLVIQQSLSNSIRAQLTAGQTVNASITPAAAISLVGSMASTSSRGPSVAQSLIKPEIGAPGASISAEVGTGNGESAFGGTSGATPMVSGAAALLIQAFPDRSPERIKAMLMNSAETAVYTNLATAPGQLAPITRIGAGELRVNRAIGLQAIAWDRDTKSAALSFGAVEADRVVKLTRKLRVENLGRSEVRFAVAPSFRYADDQESGAVSIKAPSSLSIGRGGSEDLEVQLTIDPTKLPSWVLNGGSLGGRGDVLNGPEYDGYITLSSGSQRISVPWEVLPRKAASTSASEPRRVRGGLALQLRNRGAEMGEFDVFSLTGTSPRLPTSSLPKPGDSFAVIDLRSIGVRFLPAELVGVNVLEFAIDTQSRRSHPNYPAEFDIAIDTNNDGSPDYVVFNTELGGAGATGQNVVELADLATGAVTAMFYTDADLNSGNVIMDVLMDAADGGIGVQPGQTVSFDVYAFDNYFTGNLTDQVTGMRFTPGNARYSASDVPFGAVLTGGRAALPISVKPVADEASTESGVLLMYRRNADREAEAVPMRH